MFLVVQMENKQQHYSSQLVLTIAYFGFRKGPGNFFMGVLEKSWIFWLV